MEPEKWIFGVNLVEGGGSVRLRCPHCRHTAVFIKTEARDVQGCGPNGGGDDRMAGVRICPNDDCRKLVFVVHDASGVLLTYPAETIDFDASNLPEGVLASLEEAIGCLASGYVRAAAIMVRRTLEELCADRAVTGRTLNDESAR